MGHKRKRQNERAGRFTDSDGFKDHSSGKVPAASSPQSPEACFSEYPCQRESQLIGRAVRERWPITTGIKQSIVDRLAGIVSDGADAESIAAARVLTACEKQNLEDKRAGVHIDNFFQQVNQAPATEPAALDVEYVRWRQRRLMGIKDPEPEQNEPEPALAELVAKSRALSRQKDVIFEVFGREPVLVACPIFMS